MVRGVLASLRGDLLEPSVVQPSRVGFGGAGEVPAVVPNFNPSMVARIVRRTVGVPTSRAGTETLRQASLSRTDKPLQDASPCSMDSFGLWFACLRRVE